MEELCDYDVLRDCVVCFDYFGWWRVRSTPHVHPDAGHYHILSSLAICNALPICFPHSNEATPPATADRAAGDGSSRKEWLGAGSLFHGFQPGASPTRRHHWSHVRTFPYDFWRLSREGEDVRGRRVLVRRGVPLSSGRGCNRRRPHAC